MKHEFDACGTIGPHPCEKSLNSILAEVGDSKLTTAVMRRYNYCRHGLKALQDVKDPHFKTSLILLWRDHCLSSMDKAHSEDRHSPTAVYTHLRCCLVGVCREALRPKEAAE